MYCSSHLEDVVFNLYKSLNIKHPYELDLRLISKKLKLKVYYFDDTTTIIYKFGRFHVFINANIPSFKQWEEFSHELGHSLINYGDQWLMSFPYRQLQEWQANNFTYHFCVPAFMLRELKEISIQSISETFNVDYAFASKRLEMYQNKFMGVVENAGAYH